MQDIETENDKVPEVCKDDVNRTDLSIVNSCPLEILLKKDLHSLSLFEKEQKKSRLLRKDLIIDAPIDEPLEPLERSVCSTMITFNLKKKQVFFHTVIADFFTLMNKFSVSFGPFGLVRKKIITSNYGLFL